MLKRLELFVKNKSKRCAAMLTFRILDPDWLGTPCHGLPPIESVLIGILTTTLCTHVVG